MTSETAAAGWQGTLSLTFGQRQGQTVPLRQRATAPLKLQRPFYEDASADGSGHTHPDLGPRTCQSVIVHTAGGIVGGDQLQIEIQAESHTQALVTTAAASKVYRSVGPTAQQITQITLEPTACLAWLPQETIIFNRARYQQRLRVDLAPGAFWSGWDITRFGRSAAGETFADGHWQSWTEIWQAHKPLWIERQQLQGGSEVLASPHGLANQPVIGSFVMLGDRLDAEQLSNLQQIGSGLPPPTAGEGGITQLQTGLLCRYRGASTQAARHWFTQLWQALEPKVTGNIVTIPRVWG